MNSAQKKNTGSGSLTLFGSEEVPQPLRKAVEVVHSVASTPLGLVERKVMNIWIKNVHESQPDRDGWFSISLAKMEEAMDYSSHNRAGIVRASKAMMGVIFEWDVLAPAERKQALWKASVLFPEVEVHNTEVKYRVSSEVRPQLERPTIYALIDLNVSNKLRRAGAMGMYEFCVRYEKIGRTAKVEWQTFRDMILGKTASQKLYEEYKYFKSRVLNPCLIELNLQSPLTLELLEEKDRKVVTTIQFLVTPKDASATQDVNDENKELIAMMTGLKLPASEARKLLAKHDPADIRRAVEFTKQRMANKSQAKLENPGAYFRTALSQGYAEASIRPEDKGRPAKPAAPKVDLLESYLSEQADQAAEYFKELDAGDQASFMERYNAAAIPQLQLGKKHNKASERAFYRWLAIETWGEPTTEQLLSFAAAQLAKSAG